MITVESLIQSLAIKVGYPSFDLMSEEKKLAISAWDQTFLTDMDNLIYEDKSLSVKQGALALKILAKFKTDLIELNDLTEDELENFFNNPKYRNQPHYTQVRPREVRYLGSNLLAFRSSYNNYFRSKIKKLKANEPYPSPYPHWNAENKIWIVAVSVDNLDQVMNIIRKMNFNFDEGTEQLLLEVANSVEYKNKIEVESHSIKITVSNDMAFKSFIEDYILPMNDFLKNV